MRGDRVFIASGLCTSMLVSSFNNLAEGSCRNSEHTWNGYSYCHVQNAPRKKKVKKCAVSPKDEHVGFIRIFFKYSRNTDIHICTSTHSYKHIRTTHLYEHLRKTEPAWSWDSRSRSLRTSRCRRGHRLPLKE
jgi:hypothetical protein